jgi:capsular polysaccharide biosynthesis protein
VGVDCAILTDDYKLLLNVSHQFNTKLDRQNHSIFKRLKLPSVKRLKGVVAVIGSAGSYNYYHWMLDILPRYEILKKSKYFSAIDFFIINEVDRPFQKETLALLEISAEKLVYINESTHFQAEQLLVPSLTKYRELTPVWVVEFLKELILSKEDLSAPVPGGDRIYITRGKANNRKIVNEGEVIELLKRYGFEVLSLEDFTVYQQAKIFQQAKVLIAPHGASQTNLVFCEDRTKVMEFFSPAWIHHCYYALSRANKLDYNFLLDESTEKTSRSASSSPAKGEDIFVDLSGLQKFLESL